MDTAKMATAMSSAGPSSIRPATWRNRKTLPTPQIRGQSRNDISENPNSLTAVSSAQRKRIGQICPYSRGESKSR